MKKKIIITTLIIGMVLTGGCSKKSATINDIFSKTKDLSYREIKNEKIEQEAKEVITEYERAEENKKANDYQYMQASKGHNPDFMHKDINSDHAVTKNEYTFDGIDNYDIYNSQLDDEPYQEVYEEIYDTENNNIDNESVIMDVNEDDIDEYSNRYKTVTVGKYQISIPNSFHEKDDGTAYYVPNNLNSTANITYSLYKDIDTDNISLEKLTYSLIKDYRELYGNDTIITYDEMELNTLQGSRIKLKIKIKNTIYEQLIVTVLDGNILYVFTYTNPEDEDWMDDFENCSRQISKYSY